MADMEKDNSEETSKEEIEEAKEKENKEENKEENASVEETEKIDETEPESEETEQESLEGDEKLSWSEKRAAKKQAKADKKEEAFKEKIDQLEDRVKRQMAEFENYRKRTDREKQAMFDMGAKSVLEKILPIVDNFERGLQTVSPENTEDPFVDGMNRIYKQLMTELENLDVKPIEAVGCEFDPNFHNAVMQVESEEYESGVIAQELQKGYTYHDAVLRHSMVAVVS